MKQTSREIKWGGKRAGAGRKKGIEAEILRRLLIDEVIRAKQPIVAALISRAKNGDMTAIKIILDRILGKDGISSLTEDGLRPIPILAALSVVKNN